MCLAHEKARSATFETGISVISLHEKCLFSLYGLFITETIKYHPDSTYLPPSNDCGFFGVANVLYVRVKARGVGTGGGGKAPKFSEDTKSALFRWQSALCLREKCCSDCIFDSRMLQSNICDSLWLLECGAVKQWEMTSMLPAALSSVNSFCHFHLISSVSRPQRPLIYDCIYFSFPKPPPPPGANISWKNLLAALFIPKVPLETGVPPPNF